MYEATVLTPEQWQEVGEALYYARMDWQEKCRHSCVCQFCQQFHLDVDVALDDLLDRRNARGSGFDLRNVIVNMERAGKIPSPDSPRTQVCQ